MTRVLSALLPLVLAVAVAGCTAGSGAVGAVAPSGVDSCAALPAPSSDGPADGAGRPLPELTLACFSGGRTVQLGQLRGPMVVNLWASWCGPCRTELPAFQRYADRTQGLVTVLGVDTADTRTGGISIIEDFDLTFPMLVDEKATLQAALGRSALPVTLFVDRAGRIAYLYNSTALDEETLELLVEQHLGIVVPRQ